MTVNGVAHMACTELIDKVRIDCRNFGDLYLPVSRRSERR
jgi:hypothetical protein